jgi:hypothetical protein
MKSKLIALLNPRRLPACCATPPVQFANVGEGDFGHGRRSMLMDASVTLFSRYLLYKTGSDGDHAVVCGAGDIPIGQSDDQFDSNNTDVPIAINMFGVCPGTLRVITDGTITNGGYVMTGANGQATAATTGQQGIFGRALFGTDTTPSS